MARLGAVSRSSVAPSPDASAQLGSRRSPSSLGRRRSRRAARPPGSLTERPSARAAWSHPPATLRCSRSVRGAATAGSSPGSDSSGSAVRSTCGNPAARASLTPASCLLRAVRSSLRSVNRCLSSSTLARSRRRHRAPCRLPAGRQTEAVARLLDRVDHHARVKPPTRAQAAPRDHDRRAQARP